MADKKKKSKKSNSINGKGIVLIISALILGALILVFAASTKKSVTLQENRTFAGGFPTPSEIIESDKRTYFTYVDIPDIIFNKMNGVSFSENSPVAREDLRYMKVLYWGFDSEAHTGEMIVNKDIAADVAEIFFQLYKASYPIESIKLVDEYGGNDEVSMSNNNTSCFNARKATESENTWSRHAYGMAIDINPLYNPYIATDGTVLPISGENYADRTQNFRYKIDENDFALKLFKQYGFGWGGDFETVKDYQHFEK